MRLVRSKVADGTNFCFHGRHRTGTRKFPCLRLGLYWGFQQLDRQMPGQLLRADGSFDSFMLQFLVISVLGRSTWHHLFTDEQNPHYQQVVTAEWNANQEAGSPFLMPVSKLGLANLASTASESTASLWSVRWEPGNSSNTKRVKIQKLYKTYLLFLLFQLGKWAYEGI